MTVPAAAISLRKSRRLTFPPGGGLAIMSEKVLDNLINLWKKVIQQEKSRIATMYFDVK
jgi:hypothetical protein